MRAVFALVLLIIIGGCGEGESPSGMTPRDGSPRIYDQPDTTVAYGDTLRLTASATDPDGDVLAFSMAVMASLSEIRSGYLALAGIDRDSGAFWFYPNSRDIPSRSFRFIVTDTEGLIDSTTFRVTAIPPR